MNPSSKNPPTVVVACATFKGTLSSKDAGDAIARGLKAAGIASRVVALADGGEGLVDALVVQISGAQKVSAACRGPRLAPVSATFALLPDSAAVIEMAASSGLGLIPQNERDPKLTTTLGVGDQITAALNQRQTARLLLGLGGSATNDGGAGMAQALGAQLLDESSRELLPGGASLFKLQRIDVSRLDKRLKNLSVTVACDVRNPLCGPNGASNVYGKQKGGTPDDLKLLDEALANYAEIIKRDLGKDVASIPGAGAAGGLGAGCLAFLDAQLKPGIELVLDTVKFDETLSGASLVITGEGCLDDQTLMGKAPAGVAARATKRGLNCIAIGGGIDRAHDAALKKTFARIESLSEFAGSTDAAIREPARWLENLAKTRASDWLG